MDWQLFVDLDGVLVDFDAGVRKLCGAGPDELAQSAMWKAIAKSAGFYDKLGWMPDGRKLWEALVPLGPVILTGLPWGNWAEAQKRRWCERELGPGVPVITCLSRDKHLAAQEYLEDGKRALLIDDRLKLKDAWEDLGGVFIHHRSTDETLAALNALGVRVP